MVKKLIMSFVLVSVVLCTASAVFAIPEPSSAPEIDPGMAIGALSVLIAGSMILLGRREKK